MTFFEEPASKGQSRLPLKILYPPFHRYMYIAKAYTR